jgi:nucleoside-diphosphate-sugar epimerase
MKIFVTGARGFLGSHVVDSLRKRGAEVHALGRQDGDLREPDVAEFRLQEADTIIHLAADVGGVGYLKASSGRAFHDNLRLGLNVIRAACTGSKTSRWHRSMIARVARVRCRPTWSVSSPAGNSVI